MIPTYGTFFFFTRCNVESSTLVEQMPTALFSPKSSFVFFLNIAFNIVPWICCRCVIVLFDIVTSLVNINH